MKSRPEKSEALTAATDRASSEVTQPIKEGFNMFNSTQVSASRSVTVPFHGADLYVVEHNGQPYTPMKPIVEGMGLAWQPQHRKLAANESRWGITIMVMPLQGVSDSETPSGGAQKMLVMPLRKLPGWLATIDPGRVKNEEARAKVVEYQNECDDVLWQYWNEGLAVNPRAFSVHADQTLTAEQADDLRKMVESWAKKLSSDTKVQGKFIMQAWSKLKSHYKVSYRQIPQECLHEALSIVGRHAAQWEVVDEAAQQPAPTAAREALNASDMQHIKRVVWFAARNFHRENAACQGIWHHLRQVTYNPAPNAYSVDHIPVLAAELRRIVSLCDQVGQITRHVEEQAIKRIFRKGETAEKVLAHLSIEAARDVQKLSETVAEFPAWMEADLIGFSERRPALFVNHYEPEQSDFFVGA